MTVVLLLVAVVLVANVAVLAKLTALVREWVAEMDRRARVVPDAAAGVHTHLDRINGKLDRLLAGGVRIEAANAVVADDLVVAQQAVADIAVDAAQAHARADATDGPHGAAADAASRTGEA